MKLEWAQEYDWEWYAWLHETLCDFACVLELNNNNDHFCAMIFIDESTEPVWRQHSIETLEEAQAAAEARWEQIREAIANAR
jgi:hypothetical protein